MYSYIEGKLVEKNPAYAVIDVHGIGYMIHISLNTYGKIGDKENCRLLLHHVVREDAQLLFGFADEAERELFRQLISVSGIGSNTARLILSSLPPDELKEAIITRNTVTLKAIKGIGAKSAERIIVDLRDKLEKEGIPIEKMQFTHNTKKQEALRGLAVLGFPKSSAEKAIDKILEEARARDDISGLTVEEIIKKALKML